MGYEISLWLVDTASEVVLCLEFYSLLTSMVDQTFFLLTVEYPECLRTLVLCRLGVCQEIWGTLCSSPVQELLHVHCQPERTQLWDMWCTCMLTNWDIALGYDMVQFSYCALYAGCGPRLQQYKTFIFPCVKRRLGVIGMGYFGLNDKFRMYRYILCWQWLSVSKIMKLFIIFVLCNPLMILSYKYKTWLYAHKTIFFVIISLLSEIPSKPVEDKVSTVEVSTAEEEVWRLLLWKIYMVYIFLCISW